MRGTQEWARRWWRVLTLGLASVLLLGEIIGALILAITLPHTLLEEDVHWNPVTGIVLRSSERATRQGLFTGDIVVALGRAPAQAPAGGEGLKSRITLLRAGATREIVSPYIPWRYELMLRRLLPIIVSGLMLLFGIYIWARGHNDPVAILFLAVIQCGAAAMTTERLSLLVPGQPVLGVIVNSALALLGAVLIHVHLLCPHRYDIKARPWVIGAIYVAAGAALCIDSFCLLNAPPGQDVGSLLTRGWFVFGACMAVLLIAGAWCLALSYYERTRLRLIVFAIASTFAPVVCLAILPNLLWGKPVVAPEWTYFSLLLLPWAYGSELRKSNLLPMSLSRLMNRSVIHLVVLLVIAGALYFVLLLTLPLITQLAGDNATFILAAVALLMMVFALLLYQPVLKFADGLNGGWYKSDKVIAEMSQRLIQVQDIDQLGELLVDWLGRQIRSTKIALLLAEGERDFMPVRCQGVGDVSLPPIPRDAPLVLELERHGQPVRSTLVSQLDLSPSAAIQRIWHEQFAPAHWVPLLQGSRLQGLLIVGRHDDGTVLSESDELMLATVARQAATTVANMVLVRQLEARVQERTEQLAIRNAELAAANDELARVQEARRQWVLDAVHDVRNHLNTMQVVSRSVVTTLMSQGVPAEAVTRIADRLQNTLDASVMLLGDIADASQLRSAHIDLRPIAVDLLHLVAWVIQHLEPRYESRGCTLTLNCQDEVPPVWCDPSRITRVLRNVLENALNYTEPKRGCVEVTIWQEGAQVLCEVRDNGRGLSRDDLAGLQGRLARAARGETVEGTRRGLNLSARLMGLSAGSIAIDSAGPYRGVVITLGFQLAPAGNRPRPALIVPDSRRGFTVVIVEDDVSFAEELGREVRHAGGAILGTYAHGDEAQASLQRGLVPDVVVLDNTLAGDLCGIDLARWMSQQRHLSSTIRIACGGFDEPLTGGAPSLFHVTLAKPIIPTTVVAHIWHHLETVDRR